MKPLVLIVENVVRICFFALCDIKENDELLYDYGVPSLPWRKKKKPKTVSMYYTCSLYTLLLRLEMNVWGHFIL